MQDSVAATVQLLISALLLTGDCGPVASGLSGDESRRTSSCCDDASGQQEQEKASDEITEIVASYWQKIKSVDEETPADGDDAGLQEYWVGVAIECEKLFKEMLMKGKDERAVIESFESKFGRDGAKADIRWILCSRSCTLDMRLWDLIHEWMDGDADKLWRKRQLLMAEFQTRRYLKDRKAFEQYYHCVIWADWIFNAEQFRFHVGQTAARIERQSDYWWYARKFIVMAHGTGRDDLLKDAKPEDLAGRFREWQAWLKTEGPFLRPSTKDNGWSMDAKAKHDGDRYEPFVTSQELPSLANPPGAPFADWKGPSPMAPKILRRL
jgi:hypothetical protein